MMNGIWENNVLLIPLTDSILDLSRLGPVNGQDKKPSGNRRVYSQTNCCTEN
jgi:hypothetical protein